jgi:hypothetical protein
VLTLSELGYLEQQGGLTLTPSTGFAFGLLKGQG